jgi:copper chaperone NosL
MRKILVYCLMITVLAGFGGDAGGAAPPARCPVCGMFVAKFTRWNASLQFREGSQVIFDGAKCLFKYYLEIKKYNPARSPQDIAAMTVKDYYGQASLDARQAFYVIWSDVYGPMGHEPLPFAAETAARKFLKEHKGKEILKFENITPQLIFSLDNP